MERNLDGLIVENASVAVRDSVAVANTNTGFWAHPVDAGTTTDLSADNCQATHNGWGFIAFGGAGTAQLVVSNSVASSNTNIGISADSNSTVRASNNTVTRNGTGLQQGGSGVFRSRGNNTVEGNTTETSGTITPFGPM